MTTTPTFTVEPVCGEDPHDPSACYYRVMSSDNASTALASFDTRRQAEAFIQGIAYRGDIEALDRQNDFERDIAFTVAGLLLDYVDYPCPDYDPDCYNCSAWHHYHAFLTALGFDESIIREATPAPFNPKEA